MVNDYVKFFKLNLQLYQLKIPYVKKERKRKTLTVEPLVIQFGGKLFVLTVHAQYWVGRVVGNVGGVVERVICRGTTHVNLTYCVSLTLLNYSSHKMIV